MKMSIKFYSVAIAALMALGSLAFVSCDKENDAIAPQTEQSNVSPKSLQFLINEVFCDSMGRYWNMHGTGSWINVNGGRNGVYLNINFRQRGDDHIYYYKGEAIHSPGLAGCSRLLETFALLMFFFGRHQLIKIIVLKIIG